MSIQVVGTCGNCGGRVTVPTVWLGIYPPKPKCERCHATQRTYEDNVLPMNPPPPKQPAVDAAGALGGGE